jgi:hypothetical protein
MLRTSLTPFVLTTALAAQVVIPISPNATFHRTNADPFATDSQAIPIQAAGVQAGDWLRLRLLGDWDAGGTGDIVRDLVGVFAASGTLGPATQQLRLTGPVNAGTAYLPTSGTTIGNLPMDIDADFWIARTGFSDEVTIRVPAGAADLFVAVPDSFFGDNSDPDADLAIEITLVPPPAYGGSGGEDLLLGTALNGGALDLQPIVIATGAATLQAKVQSPLGVLINQFVLIVVDYAPTSSPPIHAIPDTWFGINALIPWVDFLVTSTSSQTYTFNIPAGFAGNSLWLQGGALWPNARNGVGVLSEAHEIRLQ